MHPSGSALWRPALLVLITAASALCQPAPTTPTRPPGTLTVSVYATATDVLQHLAPPEHRDATLARLRALDVTRVFLEGRRGDEYVPPAMLREVGEFLAAQGIRTAGGIATVPGERFGVRQNGGLGWLNWTSQKTQGDVARFFAENAPLFDELIVDDFFCTADTSAASEVARGDQSWSHYRRDLLVSLIEPIMIHPARLQHPDVQLIIKFPQWYDRFHLFGYDPERMAALFNQVWVGTEVRNPLTRRMGYVQPTEGYMNFRWLASVCGAKTAGAWFDHIECTPENFQDQACQSVLAGAREITLFRLGDIAAEHPGDLRLRSRLPALVDLAAKVEGRARRGVCFYKPPNSEADDNLYLADYLGMIGVPVLPQAHLGDEGDAVFLAAQAARDPGIVDKLRHRLEAGATVLLTPAFLRRAEEAACLLAGASVGTNGLPAWIRNIRIGSNELSLARPLEVDAGLKLESARILLEGGTATGTVPLLVERPQGRGRVLVFNTRTFSEEDFRSEGEWLLSPKPRGLPELPQAVADELRRAFLQPLQVELSAPAGVGFYLFEGATCLYNFCDEPAPVRLNDQSHTVSPHDFLWLTRR